MARWQNSPKPRNQEEWEDAGREAILDLLAARDVIPWHEAEARISHRPGWNGFPPVQPVQLNAARRQLLESGHIVSEQSDHSVHPVTTLRLPFPPNRKRAVERARGRVRKLYRKYLSWTGDPQLCGRHAERVVLESAKASASRGGLYVPTQAIGNISEVSEYSIAPNTLDVVAHILDIPSISRACTILFEVKNVHSWLYPWAPEIWELLTKTAKFALQDIPVLPILVCPRIAYPTWQMAQDTGFLTVQLTKQLFSPRIPEDDFEEVVDTFGLHIERFDETEINPHVENMLTNTLRRSPISPPKADIPWFQRQVDRFRKLAPVFGNFDVLSASLPADKRRGVWQGARSALSANLDWPSVKGW